MAQAEPHIQLLQLPNDVLSNIVKHCGPREKLALFLTCHSARRLVLVAIEEISVALDFAQLPQKPRPSLLLREVDGSWLAMKLKLQRASLTSLKRSSEYLAGIKHLQLVGLFAGMQARNFPATDLLTFLLVCMLTAGSVPGKQH
jgi:hypothetical protein